MAMCVIFSAMEDNSETHMETDVTSTTEDVPETQEVTGSNGSVEMVIVVEKMEEEEDNNKTDKALLDSEIISTGPTELSSDERSSPAKDLDQPKTVIVSPTKDIEQPCSSSYVNATVPISPCNIPSPIKPTTEDVTSDLLQTEVVDSSSKMEITNPVTENITNPEINPPKMVQDIDEPEDKSLKDIQSTATPIITPEEIPLHESSNDNVVMTIQLSEKAESKTPTPAAMPIDVIVEREDQNVSQVEIPEVQEKDHNKSISRELKSLIKSAKESKIISECTQLKTKTRKSRVILDSSNASLNASIEAEKIHGARRHSNNSQKSNCSEKSDKPVTKRSMRSQNPEFVNKVKQFLNSVTGKMQKEDDMTDDELEENKPGEKVEGMRSQSGTPKKKKPETLQVPGKLQSDLYCWRCHWQVEQAEHEKTHAPMHCNVCPRSFHYRCLSSAERNKITEDKSWVCPDCLIILNAESSETRSPAMKKISLGMLCELLKFALERMMDLNGVEPFMTPVDREAFPDYEKYVVHPMDLSRMKSNIANGLYGSTEAFYADAQWILHNSIIFNTRELVQSKLTGAARAVVRSCRAEMGEIEACPECYAAAHARKPTWFTDVCSTPHILLWAKLKGFPYWPAKGMSVSPAGLVDVRFFGAHDRAWVPAKDCFLYSEKDPNNFRTKRQDILDSMQEAEEHIRNISRKYGKFVYPPFRTQFDPAKLNEQMRVMIPSFEGEIRVTVKDKSPNTTKDKSRTNSKCSKNSTNGSDISEAEDLLGQPCNKINDNINDSKDEVMEQNQKLMEVDESAVKDTKETENSRKRRRSCVTDTPVQDNTANEKKKRVDDEKSDKKIDTKDMSNKELPKIKKKEPENVIIPIDDDDSVISIDESNDSVKGKEKIVEKNRTVTPIKIILPKHNRHTPKSSGTRESPRTSTPNDKSLLVTPKDERSASKQKNKPGRSSTERQSRESKSRHEKRRNSKSNKSLNGSISSKNEKNDRMKTDKNNENPNAANKEKPASKISVIKVKDSEAIKLAEKTPPAEAVKSVKDRTAEDDDTSLAAIARDTARNADSVIMSNPPGMPTISSVRSLSTLAQGTSTTTTKTNTASASVDITADSAPDSSALSNTDSAKSQKARNENEPMVGRVGVRAFARMTSPERNKTNNVQVEIKTEPIDLDDPSRHMEKMDLMNAFKLRPVNQSSSLREVRFNKVVVTPLTRRAPTGAAEIRPRAKKTFPQPKKPEDCQLNGKNSMVYIPIQPAITQAPARLARPAPASLAGQPRCVAPIIVSSSGNNGVNTVTTQMLPPTLTSASTAVTTPVQLAPTVGQVPTTVHTVPLMTSVNGQWMFSLQPVMSVGAIDSNTSPLVNGVPERLGQAATVVPAAVVSPAPATPACPAPLAAAPPSRPGDSVVTNTPTELPRLQQRPPIQNPLDPNFPIGIVPAPSTVGPLTAKLNQNAIKLADFFRTLLEDSLDNLDDPSTQVTSLKLQLEQTKWRHQQRLDEIKHNFELSVAEMRATFEKEKQRLVMETRRLAQIELETAVKLAKSKQWCANCSQEAQFYCCWNTSYCDYPCQRAHWSQHYSVCTQQRSEGNNNNNSDGTSAPESRSQTDKLPKSTVVPTLTVGGKLASRSASQDSTPMSSIIMSMVEDVSGNQTVKCVGTYNGSKAGAVPAQIPPLIINKQIMNEENKKVVTSGGYLIVGSTSNASVNPPRRTHTLQYFT
ncbi:MYND-type zinc finger-containing chromatin reader Zmynd8 isoform X4 [Bombyx mori]|uniref:Protein kinase C-binding protein 1-like n=1 Tax=Bombyx mori TaxID=7091 RepID=A0A8R2R2B6_BOMMO|nr:uncharacterized protein LOC101739573 isoform X4 [Bombyx mori]